MAEETPDAREVLASRIILVTGGNKGIGFAVVRRLAELGHRVLLGSRDLDRGASAVAELAADGLDTECVQIDVTDEISVAAAAAEIDVRHARLDTLVNNAGCQSDDLRSPTSITVSDMRRTYETNVFGLVAVTRAMLPLLRRSAAGRIVNVSSTQGSLTDAANLHNPHRGGPRRLSYNSSKAALNMITLMYAKELANEGILVNAAAPGWVATDINDYAGPLTAEEGARVPARLALLPDDGPTGAFIARFDDAPDGAPAPW